MLKRLLIFVVIFVFAGSNSFAQYNTDRLLQSGELALENNDYVVAIQHCNNVISNKPKNDNANTIRRIKNRILNIALVAKLFSELAPKIPVTNKPKPK